MSVGPSSVNVIIKVGAYTGRFDNLNLARINNPIPNLTTVYLYTPLVGPTPDSLEYVPSPGRLGQHIGYPPISSRGGPYTGVSKIRPPPHTPTIHQPPTDASPHWSGTTTQCSSGNGPNSKFKNFGTKGGTPGEFLAA